MDVLQRAGVPQPRGDAGFEVLVRRLASELAPLRLAVGDLQNGYDAVVGAVRDLLDAGFLPGNEDGVLERLEDVAGAVAEPRLLRAQALVRLASEVLNRTDELGAWRSMQALQLAEDQIHTEGSGVLPTAALVVHGFADVTGVAADLLLSLVRAFGGVVILDRPADPVAPDQSDAGSAYLARLDERLAHLDRETAPPQEEISELALAEAPDVEAEARWVAEQIGALLAEGTDPEEIGVVGRSLDGMAIPLRRHFRRLGVPFSGIGAMVPGAGPRRQFRRLIALLRKGEAAAVDLWLEARGEGAGHSELLLGLRVLGVLRVADLAELSSTGAFARGVRLPVSLAEEDEESVEEVDRPTLAGEVLGRAASAAGRVMTAFAGWPNEGPSPMHREHLVAVLDALAWSPGCEPRSTVNRCLTELDSELSSSLDLRRSEWLDMVDRRLQQLGEIPLGGAGGGVQVLTVMEARARTFAHLFVVGVNRGVFPRIGHEDPMLPEAVRLRLAADVLPEMPVKARSSDEERYLFAQLLSSAPSVKLSWHLTRAEAKLTRSPFVDRLAMRPGWEEPEPVAPLWAVDDIASRPRPAYEFAVVVAPQVESTDRAAVFEAAIAEGRSAVPRASSVSAEDLAAARVEVLAAVNRPAGESGADPWFGFVGETGVPADEPMWVTHLEATAVCPWRAFIAQRLKVVPLPDPRLGLPAIDGPLVGQVVHEVLDEIVRDALEGPAEDWHAALQRASVDVPWPDPDRFDALLERAARRVARREGVAPLGLTPLLMARARRALEVARKIEWGSENRVRAVLASEIQGTASVAGIDRPLSFRADRMDRGSEGPRLVDYKAAKPFSDGKTEATRAKHLLAQIGKGRLLQAAAYARAPDPATGSGRYLYLKPNEAWDEGIRQATVLGDDPDATELFAMAVRTIFNARREGVFFPRVEEADGKKAQHCQWCRVAEACRRDDSDYRRHLVSWMGDASGSATAEERAARDLWWLGEERRRNGE
jgi:hypothetical protein